MRNCEVVRVENLEIFKRINFRNFLIIHRMYLNFMISTRGVVKQNS